jgi:MOB kinase activator 1
VLPQGEDRNEWLAVNTVDFFNQINLLYGSITEFCTDATCPIMSAGPTFEYQWMDGVTVRERTKIFFFFLFFFSFRLKSRFK